LRSGIISRRQRSNLHAIGSSSSRCDMSAHIHRTITRDCLVFRDY
jgi:hypothetical protein